ncbi:hypothetical protein ABGB16_14365 [Micromonospora sp. B11E3]|uniref:phthiocerol/phthiodiolone dimycocerosyl transferase family protein n=1 Tax=Micromonospora sp. B11E3 TaxID=3153562 RepID=UPI00325E5440
MTSSTGIRTLDRPLSPVEKWYWICDQLSPLNVVARGRVDGDLPVRLLREALDLLQSRHPLLRVAVADADEREPRLVPTGAHIPLRQVVAAADDDEERWVRELNDHELVEHIDWRTGPLARAVVVTHPGDDGEPARHDLLLGLVHSIADGTTVLALARQWLELAAALRGEPAATGRGAERILPPPDELLPETHRGEAGARLLTEKQERDQAEFERCRPARIEPEQPVPFERRRTALLHRELTPAQLDAVVAAAARAGATVHGALAAAIVAAVARDTPGGTDHVAIGSPITFRGDLAPPVGEHEVGTYVATVGSVVRTAPFWEMARQVSADVAARRARGEHLSMVNLLLGGGGPQTRAEWREFLEFMEANGPINLCLSNLGRLDFPDRIGPWRVAEPQFVTGLSVNGYFVATASTSHGRLFWNFTYITDAVSHERARRLADGALDALLAALDEPTS